MLGVLHFMFLKDSPVAAKRSHGRAAGGFITKAWLLENNFAYWTNGWSIISECSSCYFTFFRSFMKVCSRWFSYASLEYTVSSGCCNVQMRVLSGFLNSLVPALFCVSSHPQRLLHIVLSYLVLKTTLPSQPTKPRQNVSYSNNILTKGEINNYQLLRSLS